MSGTPGSHRAFDCRIEGPIASAAREFKTFMFPLVGTATTDLPAPPGAVQRDGAGRSTLLHFAPGRFLAPAPATETVRHLDALATAGVGSVFDVAGKWCELRIAGADSARLLAATIDVSIVLSHRDCAAVALFDCPAVLARAANGFDLWVQSSYAADLAGSLARVRLRA